MKRNCIWLSALLAVLLCFSSCSFRLESPDQLIRAPKLTGENQQVQKTLDSSVGESMVLKTPLTGEYSSAFIYRDIDSDGSEECIAFYALKSDDTVHMNLLDRAGEKWYSVCDLTGNGSDVYSVGFADVDGDGSVEIIVTWNILESKSNKYLSVYGMYSRDSGAVSMFSEMFTAFYTLDIDSDGSDEIFLTVLEPSGDSYLSFGRLFRYDKKEKAISLVSEIRLDSSVTAYTNICHDYNGDICRLYIDGIVSETHRMTQVLDVSSSDFIMSAPVVDGKAAALSTLRSGGDDCRDMNGDGFVEIPTYSVFPGAAVIDRESRVSESLYLTVWSRYENGSLTAVQEYILLPEWNCRFLTSPEFRTGMTAVRDLKLDRLKFCEYTENGDVGHMLFYIDRIPAAQFSPVFSSESEQVLLSDAEQVYKCTLTPYGKERGLSLSEIQEHFVSA